MMFHRQVIFSLATAMSVGLAACNQSAESAPSDTSVQAPDIAHSRDDVEKIIRAYLLEHPEVLVEAFDVLAERENAEIAKVLASDKRDGAIGPADAPVTIVEYFDYNCGYCKRSLDWLIDQSETGNVRVIFKELPILTEQSQQASMAAVAARNQDKYFELHQAMMNAKAHSLTDENIEKMAKDVGMNVTRMRKDMTSAATIEYLQDVRDEAREHGATATPAFFVNGEFISGFDKPKLEARISEILEASQ